ncbi:unnamed protein product [Adineta steineri]|uniref:Uncharacterized protein n=1 Tax=Adineta steineri TaxID=433720 RepID=A0A819PIG0_9BILA|nr:unnamed protein product [Adineta steineri]CAF4017704.1 unnamed protein product [Adineta steineri]
MRAVEYPNTELDVVPAQPLPTAATAGPIKPTAAPPIIPPASPLTAAPATAPASCPVALSSVVNLAASPNMPPVAPPATRPHAKGFIAIWLKLSNKIINII